MMTRTSGAASVTAAAVCRISRRIFGNCLHDGGEPDDRELLDRKQRIQTFARHRAAADPLEPHRAAKALAQDLHQRGAETVAGFLRRDQKYLPPGLGGRACPASRGQALNEKAGACRLP